LSSEIATAAEPLLVRVMTLLAVLPTATCPKLTVPDDTVRVPAAELFVTKDPEHPPRNRPQLKVSSPMKLNFKWRIHPPNGRKKHIGARARFIAKAN
jgi:hypothetical protein